MQLTCERNVLLIAPNSDVLKQHRTSALKIPVMDAAAQATLARGIDLLLLANLQLFLAYVC